MKLTTSDEIDLQPSTSSDDQKFSLKIEKLKERNFGLYSCRASNDLGSSEATIEISGKFEFIIPFLADISVRKKYEIIFIKYESTFLKLSESLKLSIYYNFITNILCRYTVYGLTCQYQYSSSPS